MVLNGIGGRTIAEAKERMSFSEAQSWAAYINRRGPINLGTRLEHGFALIAMLISHATGGKANMSDFMVHADKAAALNQAPATAGQVLAFFAAKKGKR